MDYLIYFTIFFIPSYLLRFSLFGLPTNVLEALVGLTLIVWAIHKFNVHGLTFRVEAQRAKFLTAGSLLLTIGLFFGTIASTDIRASLGALKSWFIVPLAFGIIARDVLKTPEQKRRALMSLAWSGAGVAIIALGYWLAGKTTFDGRLAGFYESPNMLAMYIVPALIIFAQELSQNVKAKILNKQGQIKHFKFLIVLLTFLFCVLTLALTRSLGAFTGIIGVLGMGVLYARRQVWKKLGIIFLIGIVVIGFLLPAASLFINPWHMGRSSLASRFMVWQASFKILSQYWFFGIGPATFQQEYLAQQKNFPPFLEWAIPHPHNIFLDTFLSAGLLGLVGLLLILYGFFSTISQQKENFVVSCLLLVVSYLLIHGAIDNTLWRNDMAMIFWLSLLI